MEFFLSVAIIVVLCKILGVPNILIAMGGLAFIGLVISAMALMFIYFCIRLVFSKSKKASFTRIDKPEKSPFKVAYYIVDDIEYPCVFPSEMILNDQMYRKGKTYTVMLNKRMGRVYDIYTILTCILGLLCSSFAIMGTMWLLSII